MFCAFFSLLGVPLILAVSCVLYFRLIWFDPMLCRAFHVIIIIIIACFFLGVLVAVYFFCVIVRVFCLFSLYDY